MNKLVNFVFDVFIISTMTIFGYLFGLGIVLPFLES